MNKSFKTFLWNSVGNINPRAIERILSDYAYVSFDIYDTVIRRAVPEPCDVFALISKELPIGEYRSFEKDRILAGNRARENARHRREAEVTLSEIYDCMPDLYLENKDYYIQLEEYMETKIAFPDPVMKKVYEWCVNHQKKVIFTSDMYLSIKVIKEILEKCGYDTYESILLSCEEKITKRNGKLYDRLIDICGSSKNVVHIGDHYKSDWLEAKAHGIRAIKIPRIPARTTFSANSIIRNPKCNYYKLNCLLNYGSDNECSFFQKYGFECLGPVLVGAAIHIHEMIKNNVYSSVFFLSRDGYMLKQIYDKMFENEHIKCEYMYISRKSIQFPLLCSYDNIQDYLLLNGDKKIWTYKMFCNRLGIDSTEALDNWLNEGLTENFRFYATQIETDKRIRAFFDLYKEQIVNKSLQAANIVKKYLKQIGFGGKVLIVDTGGYGTTQKCLEAFCCRNGIEAKITGAYLWLFDKPNIDAVAFPYMENTSHGGETQITELPLTAHEGTTEGYRVNNESLIEPELGEYEYTKYPDIEIAINEMQQGAIEFANLYDKCIGLNILDNETSYMNTKRVSRKPRFEEAKKFGNLVFLSDHQESFLASPQPFLSYIKNYRMLVDDFKASNWKIGFLKRLFRIPLPYYEIISYGRSFKRHF